MKPPANAYLVVVAALQAVAAAQFYANGDRRLALVNAFVALANLAMGW